MTRKTRCWWLVAALAPCLQGCAARFEEIGREPVMSPVGAGLQLRTHPIPTDHRIETGATPGNSIWSDGAADLYKDPRARRIGDILKVQISIRDKATMDNASERSRNSNHKTGVDLQHAFSWPGLTSAGSGSLSSNIATRSEHNGRGGTERSETIALVVAAVVSDVLPNGNLLISGSQEVRVNQELRVLNVSGLVDPKDISADNAVSYERIAEARIAYGGRGRIMEVQQPGWGQQMLDLILPF